MEFVESAFTTTPSFAVSKLAQVVGWTLYLRIKENLSEMSL